MSDILAYDDIRLYEPVAQINCSMFDTERIQNIARRVLEVVAGGTPERRASVGLAAVQLGEPVNFVAIDLNADRLRTHSGKAPHYIGLANLEVTLLDEELFTDVEGCHSLDQLAGLVSRFRRIRAKGYRLNGTIFDEIVEGQDGYLARVFQHEDDHNHGRTLVSRVPNNNELYEVPGSRFGEFRANPRAWPPANPELVRRHRSFVRTNT